MLSAKILRRCNFSKLPRLCQSIRFSYHTERKFDVQGKVQPDALDALLVDPADPFKLKECDSNAQLFELLHKANYSYTLNELLQFLERFYELNKNDTASFNTSQQATELYNTLKTKLKHLERTIQPYATKVFGDQPLSAEELELWISQEHERVLSKGNMPKIGKLSVFLTQMEVHDPELWLVMEKLVLQSKAEVGLIETIQSMQGFCTFEQVLLKHAETMSLLERKYQLPSFDAAKSVPRLFQGSSYVIPRSRAADAKLLAESEGKHGGLKLEDKSERDAAIRKRIRKIYRTLERNMIIAMTDINVSHYMRALEALNKTQSPNQNSFEILEYHILNNMGFVHEPKLLIKAYVAFAESGHGSESFFRGIESMFTGPLVENFRLSDFSGFLMNSRDLSRLLDARLEVMSRIPRFVMDVDLALKICNNLRSHRFALKSPDFGVLLKGISALQLPSGEEQEIRGKLCCDWLKAMPSQIERIDQFIEVYESARLYLDEPQKKASMAALMKMIDGGKIVPRTEDVAKLSAVIREEFGYIETAEIAFENLKGLK